MERLTKALVARLLLVLRLQVIWWRTSQISSVEKMLFSITVFSSGILIGRARIFRRWVTTDNNLGLFLLPEYIYELGHVKEKVLERKPHLNEISLLDVGANIGQFALSFQQVFGEAAEIVSLEPNPEVFKLLQKNRMENQNWKVLPIGLSESRSNTNLYFVEKKSAQGSFSPMNAEAKLLVSKGTRTIEVQCGPMDQETRTEFGVDSHHFTIAKIDVEGFEREAIKGLRDISFDFLLVEVAKSRDNGFTELEIVELVRETHDVQLVDIYKDGTDSDETRNVLFAVQ